MLLRAIQEVWYAGRTRRPGDEFDCSDEHFIRILSATDLPGGQKVAKVEPQKIAAPAPQTVVEAPQEQEAAPQLDLPPEPPFESAQRKRYYRRRDMTAGD